jgi:hypothetical protein
LWGEFYNGTGAGLIFVALTGRLSETAKGLPPSTLNRLRRKRLTEHDDWCRLDPRARRHMQWKVHGIHVNPRGEDDDRACPRVINGVRSDGTTAFSGRDGGLRERGFGGLLRTAAAVILQRTAGATDIGPDKSRN